MSLDPAMKRLVSQHVAVLRGELDRERNAHISRVAGQTGGQISSLHAQLAIGASTNRLFEKMRDKLIEEYKDHPEALDYAIEIWARKVEAWSERELRGAGVGGGLDRNSSAYMLFASASFSGAQVLIAQTEALIERQRRLGKIKSADPSLSEQAAPSEPPSASPPEPAPSPVPEHLGDALDPESEERRFQAAWRKIQKILKRDTTYQLGEDRARYLLQSALKLNRFTYDDLIRETSVFSIQPTLAWRFCKLAMEARIICADGLDGRKKAFKVVFSQFSKSPNRGVRSRKA